MKNVWNSVPTVTQAQDQILCPVVLLCRLCQSFFPSTHFNSDFIIAVLHLCLMAFSAAERKNSSMFASPCNIQQILLWSGSLYEHMTYITAMLFTQTDGQGGVDIKHLFVWGKVKLTSTPRSFSLQGGIYPFLLHTHTVDDSRTNCSPKIPLRFHYMCRWGCQNYLHWICFIRADLISCEGSG